MKSRAVPLSVHLPPADSFHYTRAPVTEGAPGWFDEPAGYELLLIEHGRAMLHSPIGGDALERGDLVFLRPGDAHALQARTGGCRRISVLFRPSTAAHLVARYGDDFAGRFFWHQGPRPARIALGGPALERAVNVSVTLQTSQRSLARIEHYLLQMMLHVVPQLALIDASAPLWLVRACQAAHRPEVFSRGAAGFIEAAGRGHEHVCRQTAHHLGMSPTAFINRVRMQHAAQRLGEGKATIEDIAQECGLANLSHFYKLFRSHYGTTPRAYRMRHQGDAARVVGR